jgi:hypothetical protein
MIRPGIGANSPATTSAPEKKPDHDAAMICDAMTMRDHTPSGITGSVKIDSGVEQRARLTRTASSALADPANRAGLPLFHGLPPRHALAL